jgi:hypothetical protein
MVFALAAKTFFSYFCARRETEDGRSGSLKICKRVSKYAISGRINKKVADYTKIADSERKVFGGLRIFL